MALALLPADDVLAGEQVNLKKEKIFFFFLTTLFFQNIKNTYRDDLRRKLTEIKTADKRLTEYYIDYWIDTITPERFSVFQMPNRTNNLVEA